MSVSDDQIKRAKTAAEKREARGYFQLVKSGDQRAASLFARLVAFDLNPSGSASNYGALTKPAGGQNVDGYAEDAIVFSNSPENLENVIDLVGGAGAPGARVIADLKPRRSQDVWEKPKPLSDEQMSYLLDGGDETDPGQPPSQYPPYPGDEVFDQVGVVLFADYAQAGQPPNPQMGRWFGRTIYDWLAKVTPTLDASIAKHRSEWRAILGLPPL